LRSMRVAAQQMLVTDDPDTNLRTILTSMEVAARRKCDIICFPEVCLVHDEEKIVPVEKHLRAIRSKCKELSIWCIFGSYKKERHRIRNFAFLIDRKGNLVYRYAKVHLWKSEIEHGIVPGRFTRAIHTEFGTIGIIICFDFAYPEFLKRLSQQGAEVIFCPSFMVAYRGWEDMLRVMPVMRAFENTCYFVNCDAVTADRRTAAMSSIAEPRRVLSALEKKQGMIVATLNLKAMRNLKKEFDILRE
jgi:predicted amidohydrolase